MKEITPVNATLKHKVDDFIVEEIGEKWACKISKNFQPNKSPNLDNLDIDSNKDFIACELEKVDLDHFTAIKEIANKLEIPIDWVGYAGTKDKKAHTSQRISLFAPLNGSSKYTERCALIKRLENFKSERIFLKNFKWAKRKIKIGYLEENHFKIILRNIDKKDAIKISNSVRSMNQFANYFGPQRFGSLRKNNVEIGKLILKKDWKGAIDEILLTTGQYEKEETKLARRKLASDKDYSKASIYFPRFLRLEKQILFHLSKNPEDFLGSLKRGDRKNMLMIIHSVQSKIFNDILKRALEEGLDFTKKGQQNCILVGYKTNFFDGQLGDIEQEILKNHNLTREDFDLKEIPHLRIKGSFRSAVIEIKNLLLTIENDEEFVNSKKIILEFTLPSGVYATTYLDNFFIFS
ncbi:MAG: tRNA pseudouridine(13) synthase TruD [Nanoarchaeota archaeon]|nr:tRNA pseudouridine(13) synthase TruD [Nanoarchaeota archaeon]